MPSLMPAALTHGNSWLRTRQKEIPWIWEGLVAEEAITLLSAPEKTGKSTLLSLLLDRRHRGGRLLGKTVRPGRTIVCSEEHDLIWALRQPPLDFGAEVEFHRPPGGNPTWRRWRAFVDHLLELGDDAYDLLVIDTLMAFLPGSQNTPSRLRKCLHDLRVIADYPAGVLILHQTRTSRGRAGARGFAGAFADILIDMSAPSADRTSRRRHFSGVGRYPGTLQHVAAEMNPEGTDYVQVADTPAEQTLGPIMEKLQQLLRERPAPLTRQEILNSWPPPGPPPRADSLGRCLMRACEQGILTRSGPGTKAEAFRYELTR
jgi:AAA domain